MLPDETHAATCTKQRRACLTVAFLVLSYLPPARQACRAGSRLFNKAGSEVQISSTLLASIGGQLQSPNAHYWRRHACHPLRAHSLDGRRCRVGLPGMYTLTDQVCAQCTGKPACSCCIAMLPWQEIVHARAPAPPLTPSRSSCGRGYR